MTNAYKTYKETLKKQVEFLKNRGGGDAVSITNIRTKMTEKVKFTQVSRVICPKTGVHYLDAISERGEHYTAQQETGKEDWITWKQMWKKDNSQPLDL